MGQTFVTQAHVFIYATSHYVFKVA